MSQLVRLGDQSKAVETVFKNNSAALSKVVPRSMGDPSRLLRIAYNNVAYDSALMECAQTPAGMASIFGGVMEALKLGLQIGGPMQEAWLIPFKQKGTPMATLIIGYQGYRNILDRSKSVIDIHPVAVFANDEFDFELGSRPFVRHKPALANRGEFIAAYAVAHLPRGGIQLEVMGKAEIDEHRAKSRSGNFGPWVDHYVAMAMKTVLRKLSKYLPKSSEILVRALDLDERADRGVDQNFDIEGLVFDTVTPVGGSIQSGGSKLDVLKKAIAAPKPPTAQVREPEPEPEMVEPDFEPEPDVPTAPAVSDAERERVQRERDEMARMVAKMKAANEPKPIQTPMSKLVEVYEEPIGEDKAKELLAKIRSGASKK